MIYLPLYDYDSVIQGTWASGVAGARNSQIWSSTATDGDGIQFSCFMQAGTYTCKFIGTQNTNQAIIKIKIDGDTVATFDKYGALVSSKIYTQADISVATGGVKTVQLVIDGKNESSSSYSCAANYMVFYRTA